jgi:phenylalanine-4-hydroxylase
MAKNSKYVSHPADPDGKINWSDEENIIWQELMSAQLDIIQGRACDEFIEGLALLNLPKNHIPQLEDVSKVLRRATGWEVAQVPALINFDEFFQLLANKQFPVATFIRDRNDFKYLQEPDVFHEIFGHCPLLTNPAFAHFTHTYGKLGLAASKEDRAYLARMYWFTVEFGLMKTPQGDRIYGGGILSSPEETIYALQSQQAVRLALDPVEVLRTPYRIDIIQPIYFLIDNFEHLFELSQMDIMSLLEDAKKLGLHPAKFPPKQKLAS